MTSTTQLLLMPQIWMVQVSCDQTSSPTIPTLKIRQMRISLRMTLNGKAMKICPSIKPSSNL